MSFRTLYKPDDLDDLDDWEELDLHNLQETNLQEGTAVTMAW